MDIPASETRKTSKVLFWSNSSPFSNWYEKTGKIIKITLSGQELEFRNSEALYMYLKAMFFKDAKAMDTIYKDQFPVNVKKHGRAVKNFNEEQWDTVKEECMYIACYNKFIQDYELLEYLLETGDDIIVEASPVDLIWGIGLHHNDPLALDESNWKGLNLLGKVLTQVRNDIIETLKTATIEEVKDEP